MFFTTLIPVFLLLPLLAIGAFFYRLIKGKRTGLLKAFIYYCFSAVLGGWSIFQSQSSTAALGFLILPFFMTAGAFGIWVFENYKGNPKKNYRILAWCGVATAIISLGLYAVSGYIQRLEATERLEKAREVSLQTEQYRKELKKKLANTLSSHAVILHDEIIMNADNPYYLSAVLEFSGVTPDDLKFLYDSKKVSVISILRNPSITSDLIEYIYQNEDNKDYIATDLAFNTKTPELILREVYARKEKLFGPEGLGHFFAQNPATPVDILRQLSHSKRQYTLLMLLNNKKIDCPMVQTIKASLKSSDAPNDRPTMELIVLREENLCK